MGDKSGWVARQVQAKKILVLQESGTWFATQGNCTGTGKTRAAALADLRVARATLRKYIRDALADHPEKSREKAKPRAAKRGRRPRCPHCGGPLGHSTAIITGGALRVVGGRAGRPWVEETGRAEMFAPHEAIGFLRLVWHRETAPDVTIVDASPCGQFDVYLCSIACLRAFMTARIDDLEKLSRKEERRAAPRKRRKTADAKSRAKPKRRPK